MSDRRTGDSNKGGAIAGEGRVGEETVRRPSGRETGRETATATDKTAFNFDKQTGDESIPELLRRLADQGSHLAQQQAKLVEAEVRSSVDDLKQSAGAMAGAAVLGIAGLGVLLMGLAFLLGEVMELWLATLIVAAATLAGAYAMFVAGRDKLQSSSLSVERSRRTIERAPGAVSGNTKEEPSNER
ncbi:MAG: phage holin family protein [Sphingomicrobium sp.]